MDNTIQAPQDASPEAQEILKELAAEGHQIDGISPAPKADEQPAPAPKPKQEDAPPKQDTPDKSTVEEGTKDEGVTPPKQEKVEREPKYVPVSKHNEERHKRQEAEQAAKAAREEAEALRAQLEASNKPKPEDVDAKAKRLAEKHGLQDVEFVKDLLSEATPATNALPPELLEDLKAVKELRSQQEKAVLEQKQETFFNDEFAQVVKDLPELANQKEALKQLAFSEGNAHIPLRLLAIGYLHDNPPEKPGRKTAEAPYEGSKSSSPDVIDFANITEEEFNNLSYEQLDLYDKWRVKQNKK